MGSFRSSPFVRVTLMNFQYSLRYPRSEPNCMTRPLFRARSTSHSVAVHDGCTDIPLAAGKAQEDENHSRKRRFRPWLASVRPPGSARTDQVLEDDGILFG